MQKYFNGRCVLLAGVSFFVLAASAPGNARTVQFVWGPAPSADFFRPEYASKPKKAKRSRSYLTRTVRGDPFLPRPPEPIAPRFRETNGVSVTIVRDEPRPTSSRSLRKGKKAADTAAPAAPAMPQGPLHIIVSIDQQRATLYANGTFVATTKVSTGTKSHPTPMGVFAVLQKNRHHVSRLTWSGTALHTGPLPGYPASHGCIRLTDEFAQLLWKATKIGARVIVTRDDVKPVEFSHPKLIAPQPFVAAFPAAAVTVPVRTAEVTGTVVQDQPVATPVQVASNDTPAPAATLEPVIDPRVRGKEAIASAQEIERRNSPVSIFVSRKDGRLYVRQAMQPLFDLPITLHNREQPIGTHVYTAMEMKDGAMRWTSVTIPSSFRPDTPTAERNGKRSRTAARAETTGSAPPLPPSDAASALDRFDIPQEARDRLAPLLIPGSSLIVSDNGIAGETGRYTDFIVLTR
jgi:lipoprotein-anchoring transpeptidase ErfK/SrfK